MDNDQELSVFNKEGDMDNNVGGMEFNIISHL